MIELRMEIKANNLVRWLQLNKSTLVDQMKSSNHHFSSSKLSPHHLESDVFTHLMMVMLTTEMFNCSKNAKIGALLHDIGKPLSRRIKPDDKVVFYGHESLSAFMSLDIMEEMKDEWQLDDQNIVKIFYIIANHIEFHKLYKKSMNENTLYPYVDFLRGMPKTAESFLHLGICDSIGRFANPEFDSNIQLNEILNRIDEEMILFQMEDIKIIDKNKPSIDILIGLPASGKSTYRKNIKDKEIICRDDILLSMSKGNDYQDAYNSIESSKINTALIEKFKDLLKLQKNIVIDQTSLSREIRGLYLKRCPHYHKRAIIFLEPLNELKARNLKRKSTENKFIPESVYLDMMLDFQWPNHEEFDEIVIYYKNKQIILD